MSPYLILIPIMLPLLGGFSMLFLKIKTDRARNFYAEMTAVLTSVSVFLLIFFGSRDRINVYSFTKGFAINFRIDGLSCLFAGMISVMWPLVLLYAFEYMKDAGRKNSFFAFYVMSYGITLGIAFAADILTMYVFYEMLTLVTIPLVSHNQDHAGMFAGRRYAAYVIGGASLAFIAVVMVTVYGNGGAFTYGGVLTEAADKGLMQLIFLFGFMGFGVKAAVFPLHGWLPQATVAPTPVTALLHAVAVVNSGVFAIMRLTYYSYGPAYIAGTFVQDICLALAAFTTVFGAAMALRERHLKRRLAYSTVSNLSYMLFGVMLLTEDGFRAGMAHMLFHSIIKMSLFLCAGAFIRVTGKEYIYEMNGAGRRMPFTFAFYTIGAFSLTGVPLFCGFVSKWNLLIAGAAAGTPWAVAGTACLLIAAFLCAIYTISVSIRAFFPMKKESAAGMTQAGRMQAGMTQAERTQAGMTPAGRMQAVMTQTEKTQPESIKAAVPESESGIKEAGLLMLAPIGIFAALNIIFGVWPAPVLDFLGRIAAGLI